MLDVLHTDIYDQNSSLILLSPGGVRTAVHPVQDAVLSEALTMTGHAVLQRCCEKKHRASVPNTLLQLTIPGVNADCFLLLLEVDTLTLNKHSAEEHKSTLQPQCWLHAALLPAS